MYNRHFTTILCAVTVLCCILAALPCLSADTVRREKQVAVAEGVRLHTELFLPATGGSFSTIMLRSPYAKDLRYYTDRIAQVFADAGFACVVQDCRGTGKSGGEWYPYRTEVNDGLATLRWIRNQKWCNGKIGLYGDSYLGYTQIGLENAPGTSIRAGYAHVPTFDWYETTYYGGAFCLEHRIVWNSFVAKAKVSELLPLEHGHAEVDWDKIVRHLPILTMDEALAEEIVWMRDSIRHPQRDEYWNRFDITSNLDAIECPNLVVGGWYDLFLNQVLCYANRIGKNSKNKDARNYQHIIIGPWGHDFEKLPIGRDFGANANLDFDELMVTWFSHWLKKQNAVTRDLPKLQLFVMGANRWRSADKWPLPETIWTKFFLHSNGSANSANGDGLLDTAKPTDEPPDKFVYDPNSPVPTIGGEWRFYESWGPRDQKEIECRKDVLVYTSNKLKSPLEITGPIRVVLYAATDSRDTDWTAKLVDVSPDGDTVHLCDGIIRARYREPEEGAQLLKPGKVYRYEIDLWATSNEFQPGHRIRVQISSSNFPRFDRNPNTGNLFGLDREMRVARQRVLHDTEHPSHILLPVIPW